MMRSRRGVAWALLAAPVIGLGVAGWLLRWSTDDAFIDYRIVDNLTSGHGPVFNVGERVEAYTSPLWVAMVSAAHVVTRAPIEWVSVALGLACAVAGIALAITGAARLVRRVRPGSTVLLPAGAVAVAVLPPMREFATSGLETGLEMLWLGGAFAALTRLAPPPDGTAPAPSGRWERWTAVLIGVGPLIRPEFLIFSAIWGLLLLALRRHLGWRHLLGLAVVGAAPLVGYEVFRAGYFAALVPNTAIAKDATGSHLQAGLHYLADTVKPYWLFIPAALLGGALLLAWLERRATWTVRLLLAAPVVGGLVEVAYVVRVGGDFMHARMLVPAIFALAMPVAVVAVDRRRALLAAGVAAWALPCAVGMRVPYPAGSDPATHVIADERGFWTQQAHNDNPVTAEDMVQGVGVPVGRGMRSQVEAGDDHLHFTWPDPFWAGAPPPGDLRTTPALTQRLVVDAAGGMGTMAFAAGPQVYVMDHLGLSDVLAARTSARSGARIGHEKWLGDEWMVARFADPAGLPAALASNATVGAARATLSCAPVASLLDATDDSLTPGRFITNLGRAASLTSLHVPADPRAARTALCSQAAPSAVSRHAWQLLFAIAALLVLVGLPFAWWSLVRTGRRETTPVGPAP